MIPDTGAVISTVTLSVSILAITSSALTKSPGCLTNYSTTPSDIESPIPGTFTTFNEKFLLSYSIMNDLFFYTILINII